MFFLQLGLNLLLNNLGLVLTTLAVVVPIILHWYSSPDTASDLEYELKDKVGGETLGPITTKKGNEFSFEIVEESFEVYEAESLVYRLLRKPLPFGIGGFRGETHVQLTISGNIRIEEAVLIKQIASHNEYRQLIGDLELQNDQFKLIINNSTVPGVRDALTGVRELVDIKDESIPEEVIYISDHLVLGEVVAGGVARSIVIDISLPNKHVWKWVCIPTRLFLENVLGRMNRAYVWIRQRPRRRTSTVTLRVRDPNSQPDEYTLGPLEVFSFWIPITETTQASQHLHTLQYMGYGLVREFLEVENEENAIVEQHGIDYLPVSLARTEDKLDNPHIGVDWEDLVVAILGTGDEDYLPTIVGETIRSWREENLPQREEVLIPVSPIKLDDSGYGITDSSETEVLSEAKETTFWVTVITAGGGGTVRAYYRSMSGPSYVAVEWRADGSSHVYEAGQVRIGNPLTPEGFIIWHRLHQGREKAYQPTDVNDSDVYFVPGA